MRRLSPHKLAPYIRHLSDQRAAPNCAPPCRPCSGTRPSRSRRSIRTLIPKTGAKRRHSWRTEKLKREKQGNNPEIVSKYVGLLHTLNLSSMTSVVRIHHRTGHACGSATMGGNTQSRQARAQSGRNAKSARAQSEGRTGCSIAKSTCTGYLNDILPFATLSVGCAKSYDSWANSDSLRAAYSELLAGRPLRWCVRPYGIYVQNHVSQQTSAPVST